jgi:hypothetical protein
MTPRRYQEGRSLHRTRLMLLQSHRRTILKIVSFVLIGEVQPSANALFFSPQKADWRSQQGPRGSVSKTAESRSYERNMRDIWV